MNISSTQAGEITSAAQRRAAELGVAMNIAVLDAGGHLKSFIRMDGAVLGSIEIAICKARTAILFSMNSEQIWDYCRPGGPAPGLEHTNGGLVPFAGGVPVMNGEGEVIGALGVSGGQVAQDGDVARSAVWCQRDARN